MPPKSKTNAAISPKYVAPPDFALIGARAQAAPPSLDAGVGVGIGVSGTRGTAVTSVGTGVATTVELGAGDMGDKGIKVGVDTGVGTGTGIGERIGSDTAGSGGVGVGVSLRRGVGATVGVGVGSTWGWPMRKTPPPSVAA